MDKIKSKSASEIEFQGNDFLESEANQNKEIMDNFATEEKADRSLRKLKQSHKGINKVNSGS